MMQQVISDSFNFGRVALGGIWSQLWIALGQRPSQLSHFLELRTKADSKAFLCARTSEGETLPAGSYDGLSTLDPDIFLDKNAIDRLVTSCLHCVNNPSLLSLKEFYANIQSPFLHPAIPEIKAQLLQRVTNPRPLVKLANQLVCHAPDTQAVKFGLILLSIFPSREAITLAKVFVAHDEFTLFALELLRTDREHFFDHLWELAPNVHGWGRIHLVRNLLTTPESHLQVVRLWLVTEGYRNSVFPQLLIPYILPQANLPAILTSCSDETFARVTDLFLCAMASKHSSLFLQAGWLPQETKQAYRLSALSRPRTGDVKSVLDWMKTAS